jgi:hypothetical protein
VSAALVLARCDRPEEVVDGRAIEVSLLGFRQVEVGLRGCALVTRVAKAAFELREVGRLR